MNSIEISGVSKFFGKKNEITALDNINLTVPDGQLFGLIGPDGAGKTTLFRILTTLLLAEEGTASVNGHDVVKDYKAIRKIVGYMPGKFSLYTDLSVEENLNFFATLFNTTVKENYKLIEDIYVQLEPFKNRRAGALSGGMKQKLALCCALVHKPEVLFLDEPTTGVDVVSRREFWEMLRRLNDDGITIFVSTPYMDEATMCDKIALIQNSKILSIDTPQGLIQSYPSQLHGLRSSEMYKLLLALEAHRGIETVFTFGDSHHVKLHTGVEMDSIKENLITNGHQNLEIQSISPTVEDCFLALLNENNMAQA